MKSLSLSIFVACMLQSALAAAQDVTINLFPPGGAGPCAEAFCTAEVDVDQNSDDDITLRCQGLPENTDFTVFLTESPTTGALPVVFEGAFRSSSRGRARMNMEYEVLNAFVAVPNDQNEVQQCVAGAGAGALANNPIRIPLKFLRVYFASPNPLQTVFGPGPNTAGGGICLTSDRIPDGQF